MANGASNLNKLVASSVSVSGTGAFGNEVSIENDADEIGILVTIASGTVTSLVVDLEHDVNGTWTLVTGAQVTLSSGSKVAFATVPSLGRYRVNATTVTTPSSLQVTAKVVYGKKFN